MITSEPLWDKSQNFQGIILWLKGQTWLYRGVQMEIKTSLDVPVLLLTGTHAKENPRIWPASPVHWTWWAENRQYIHACHSISADHEVLREDLVGGLHGLQRWNGKRECLFSTPNKAECVFRNRRSLHHGQILLMQSWISENLVQHGNTRKVAGYKTQME